jgi:hypothetical protein
MSQESGFFHKIKAFYETHEKRIDLAIFLGGFFFDIFTLGRPDDLFNIVQQSLYILVLLYLLKLEIEQREFEEKTKDPVDVQTKWIYGK